jgi:hypothetical protein
MADMSTLRTAVYDEVHQERRRAHAKHDAAGNSREDAAWDNAEWLPILVEEVGEAAHLLTYDVTEVSYTRKDMLRAELVQVAAMACAWIDAIDRS